jgi:hypothetical protein
VRIDVIWAGFVARTDVMPAFPSRHENSRCNGEADNDAG